MKYVMISMEACFPIDENIHDAVQGTLDELRGQGAARATGFKVFQSDEEYEAWYNSHERIQEITIPSPDMITVSWD